MRCPAGPANPTRPFDVPPDLPEAPCAPPTDAAIRRALFALLDERNDGTTLCPSEVARRLLADAPGWRALMPRVRAVAGALARDGRLRVTRRGVEVDAEAGGGPIRLSRPVPPAGSQPSRS